LLPTLYQFLPSGGDRAVPRLGRNVQDPISPGSTPRRRTTMDKAALQALQGPLKERYRDDPDAARITLSAEGRLGDENVSCSVATGRAMVEAGLHPATGGTGLLACSGDMLLE